MAVGIAEKFVLVELGNSAREILSAKCLLNVENRELRTGSSVIVRRCGHQELSTFLAKSNDHAVLEDLMILKESVPEEDDGFKEEAVAGPSTLAAEVDGDIADNEDYSGTTSEWSPSGNETSDSDISDQENRCPKSNKKTPQQRKKSSPRNSAIKKVLRPSNRANAIIPRKYKKKSPMLKKTIKNLKKLQEKENSTNNLPKEKKTIRVSVEEVKVVRHMFNELSSLFHKVRSIFNATSKLALKSVDENEKDDDAMEVSENETNESGSEDLNRSDDNVLITNKYDHIQNIGQNANDTQDVSHDQQDVVENNSTLNDNTLNDTVNAEASHGNDVYNIQSEAAGDEYVSIGSGKTHIHKDKFRKIKWASYTIATRGLMLAVFPRRVLATHSLTGKRSPAFQDKAPKMCLDPKKVSDIVLEVMDRFKVRENLIRSIITTKCADEAKMFKMRLKKQSAQMPKNDDDSNNEQPPEANQ